MNVTLSLYAKVFLRETTREKNAWIRPKFVIRLGVRNWRRALSIKQSDDETFILTGSYEF